jgi:uncharacterized protein (TIGR02246 family)
VKGSEMIATWALAVMVTSGVATVPQDRSKTGEDEAAIRQVVKTYVDAREKGDAAAVGALFTDDADQLVSSGEWRRGREALVRGTLASSKANSGRRTITIETIRFPATGVAIADGRYVIAGSDPASSRNMWTSFVLVKDGKTWRITAIRNMLPAAGQ